MNNLSNSVTLVGNLGKDVDVKTFESGTKVAQTSIATNRFYTNSKGEKVQEVEWHNVVAWNKTAELMERLLKKGNRVMIQGALKNETYKTKDGDIRYATKVKINEFQKLTLKEEALPF
jgi:single-strand DNA-binding protein